MDINNKESIKVLIVDDQALIRMLIKNILVKAGYNNIYEAESGRQAIESYNENKQDVIIMDIVMADISGKGAIRAIIESNPNANIIVCTSILDNDFLEDVRNMGINFFIYKPFNALNLIQKIEMQIELSKTNIY